MISTNPDVVNRSNVPLEMKRYFYESFRDILMIHVPIQNNNQLFHTYTYLPNYVPSAISWRCDLINNIGTDTRDTILVKYPKMILVCPKNICLSQGCNYSCE